MFFKIHSLKTALIILLFILKIDNLSNAQSNFYHHSTILDLIFSFNHFNENPNDVKNLMRFSCFLHLGEYIDFDINNHIGLFTGLTLNNIGFIAENKEINEKKKFRTYALGLPLAVKLGSFRKDLFLYGGLEYQWFFLYKEKTFIGSHKDVYDQWFSNKTPTFMPSWFVGMQFPKNFTLKFQYMLDNFLIQNKVINDNYSINSKFGIPNGRVYFISLSITNFEKIFKKKENKEPLLFSYKI